MKFGVSVPNNWGVEDPQEMIGVGVRADELGFDSLWVAEHMLNAGYLFERIGDKPYYHVLATLAYFAARTRNIALGTSVVVLPFRHPIDLAKFAATVDSLSGGRVILGVGAGGLVDEFDALGIPFDQRGKITDEALHVIKAVWTSSPASHHGERWNFDDVVLTPRPIRTPHIPIWIGGGGKAAFRRTGTLADGWQPTGISIEEFQEGVARIREIAVAAGRDPDAISMSMRVNVELGRKLTTATENRSVIPGEGQEMLDAIGAWLDAGVDHLVLAMNSSDTALLCKKLQRISELAFPAFQ